MVKINSVILLLSKFYNFRLPGFSNNPYDSTGMLNVDKGVAHVDNNLKIPQKPSVFQIQNARFTPMSLSGNVRFASNMRSAFHLPQNARPAFCQLQNMSPTFLVLNARLAFCVKLSQCWKLVFHFKMQDPRSACFRV